jgi:preprotein translocase subunit YajC
MGSSSPTVATAAAATGSSGSSTFIILIIVFIGLIYFMAIRPGRNRQKKVMQQQNTVRPGARVRTTAGMYATVVAVDGDDVVLEVAPDIEVRYLKRAIMEVLAPGDEPAEDEAEPEGAEAEYEDDASAEHEDDLHGEYGTGAGYDTVTSADAEHETEPDLSAPASTHGDDLTINGQHDATANGSGPGVKPESPASKE